MIALSDLPDRETAEYAIRAAAGGHLVIAVLDASSSVRAVERLVTTFSDSDSAPKALSTFAGCLSMVLCQTLVQHSNGQTTVPVFEILNASEAVRTALAHGQVERLHSIMNDENMMTLGRALGVLVSAGTVSREVALENLSSADELVLPSEKAEAASVDEETANPDPADTALMAWL